MKVTGGTSLPIYFLMWLCSLSLVAAQHYGWPLYPVLEPYCRGTFCEYRSDHFHEGIDIPATGTFTVYTTTDTFKYIGWDYNPDVHYIVTVQHYTQNGRAQLALDEGSRYIHMNNIDFTLIQDQIYIFRPIAQNITFLDTHLHFEMRWPAPVGVSGLENIFNAFLGITYVLTTKMNPCLIIFIVMAAPIIKVMPR